MEVRFYNNPHDRNVVVKNNKTLLKTVSCHLKENTSVKDPILIIRGRDTELDSVISKINYCQIADFGRVYFCEPPYLNIGGLIEIKCHCDVLTSNAHELKKLYAVVDRQENPIRGYEWQIDELFPVTSKRAISYLKLNAEPFSNQQQTYTLCVNGG